MVVWLGLLIGLISSLVASVADLKRPRGASPWNTQYLRRNRLTLLSMALSLLGFAVAALTVTAELRTAAGNEARLVDEITTLHSLLLEGKSVKPVITLVFQGVGDLSAGSAPEEIAWRESLARYEGPTTVGFIPSTLRGQLFPNAIAEPMLRFLGEIAIRSGRPGDAVLLQVRDDGGVVPTGNAQVLMAGARLLSESRGTIQVRIADEHDALSVLYSFVAGYERRAFTPLRISLRGPVAAAEHLESQALLSRCVRLTYALDNTQQLGVTALLRRSGPPTEAGVFEWTYAERPHIAVSGPEGRYYTLGQSIPSACADSSTPTPL